MSEMDAKTYDAWKFSVEHWRRNMAARTPRDVKLGVRHCALCGEFRTDPVTGKDCVGCPVFLRTGYTVCRKSPHTDAVIAFNGWKSVESLKNGFWSLLLIAWRKRRWVKAARKELDFLLSLRPEKGV